MAVEQCPAIWIGIDIGSRCVEAALATGDARCHAGFPVHSFPRTQAGALALLAWTRTNCGHAPVRAVLEATGNYSAEFAAWLAAHEPACAPAIVDPRRTYHFAKSLGARNKTDRDDARMLARYGAERLPAPFEPPKGAMAALRELLRGRQSLVEQRVATEESCRQAADPRLRDALGRVAEALSKEIAALDEAIAGLRAGDEVVRRDTDLLATMYGVAELTATTIVAELGDLRRFRTGRQLAAFAGLTPRRRESGTSVRKSSPITKCGTARVRRILYTSAMVAIRGDNHLARKYREMKARGVNSRAALVAIARRILIEMRAMLKSGEEWNSQRALSPAAA